MVSRSGDYTLVYNGEIYNYRELRRQLESRGVQFRSTSDTEVLLEGYALFGETIIDRIEGMFAFAIWDAKTKQVVLARDRAGEKPLYYLPRLGGVVFASEIKGILCVEPRVERDLSQLSSYLIYGYVPPPATFYEGVRQLEPAQVVRFGSGADGVPKTYWKPKFVPASRISYPAAQQELRSRMRNIVRDRLQADVPVGAFLSGGVDSATVVGVATRDLNRTVRTYSIGFEAPEVDESSDARMSAAHLGSVHEEFILSPNDIPSVELLVRHHDGPFSDSSAIPTYLVSKMARSRATVALTGDGGDELFGGYPRFVGGAIAEHLPRLAGSVTRRAVTRLATYFSGTSRESLERAERLAAAVERPLESRLLHWNSVFPLPTQRAVLLPDYQLSANQASDYNDRVFFESTGRPPISRMLDHNFRTYLPYDLLTKVDRCSMVVSLETRCPMLDSSLVDFVGSLPDSFKIQGLKRKRILIDTFRDLLAPGLLHRPKRGFALPLARWLEGPLKPQLDDAIRSKQARIYRYLDFDQVQRLLFAPEDSWRLARATQAFALWTLEAWLRMPVATAPQEHRGAVALG
jgi:asparagine synthase (glutamine-hydrolysing)